MGFDAICNNQKWMGLLDGWRQTDLQKNKRVTDCDNDAAAKGYTKHHFSWIMSDGRHLDCGYEKDIPDDTCEAKVKHYAKNLADHIYKDSGLPPIQEEAYYPHHDTILDQCHSISENLRNTDRRDDFIKWSDMSTIVLQLPIRRM